MPICLNRHNVQEIDTTEEALKSHQEDSLAEHKFGCKPLAIWFDESKQTAFHLIKAPSKQAIIDMNNFSQRDTSNSIVELDKKIVESFLGKIEDLEIDENNTNYGSAFRAIMDIELSNNIIEMLESNQFNAFTQRGHQSVGKTIKQYDGLIVKSNNDNYLVSFESVTKAVDCGLKILHSLKYITPNFEKNNRQVKIGICTGVPITNKKQFFEETVAKAKYISQNVDGSLVVTQEVKTLYENDHQGNSFDKNLVRVIKPAQETFLIELIEFMQKEWNNPKLDIHLLGKKMGLSKSGFYRRMVALTNKSPNQFLKNYRLKKSLELIRQGFGNIAEVATESGFNSASYFSKCFYKNYNILPSNYIKYHIN